MTLLDSVPITACHECVATLTLPLALFFLLAETTVGGVMTVAFLRLTGGLTHGFLKFITVTYAILAALAFLVVAAAPPGSYHRLLAINQSAAAALVFLQGLLVLVMLIQVVVTWRRQDAPIRSWLPTLFASVLLLAGSWQRWGRSPARRPGRPPSPSLSSWPRGCLVRRRPGCYWATGTW